MITFSGHCHYVLFWLVDPEGSHDHRHDVQLVSFYILSEKYSEEVFVLFFYLTKLYLWVQRKKNNLHLKMFIILNVVLGHG